MSKITHISEDITFKGEINHEDTLQIDGKMQGELKGTGKVVIGSTGNVKADIQVREIEVHGALQGTVKQADFLHAVAGANMNADIHTKEVQIDKGSRFQGTMTMT